jgi:uncharacterized protein (DUF2147 family)
MLMLLSPSAYAGNSISFTVGGHRVHIEASPHCRSTSCASVSISGIYRSRARYDDDDRYKDDRVDNAPVKPQPAQPTMAPPASRPPAAPLVVASPPAVYKPAAVATRIVVAPPPPPVAPTPLAVPPAPPPPPVLPPVAKPAEPVRPVPQISQASHDAEEDADTPIGDWQTEGKGSVRIAKCGNALCGYVINASSNERGEAVLINMKPKNNSMTARQWTGSVFSQSSGDTYYGTMDIKGANTLRVEACALGRFYCSGNNWSRIVDRTKSLMSSRPSVAAPRS